MYLFSKFHAFINAFSQKFHTFIYMHSQKFHAFIYVFSQNIMHQYMHNHSKNCHMHKKK